MKLRFATMSRQFLRQNSVQKKIKCLFEIEVSDQASTKRNNQQFRVMASEKLLTEADDSSIQEAKVTEKVDGTCCYFFEFQGKPWLWARHDQKTNKTGERKLKIYGEKKRDWVLKGKVGEAPSIDWNVAADFKNVPENWTPAQEVPVVDGVPQPDDHGHIPGWVPVNPKERQHLWHLAAVDLEKGEAIVLRPNHEAAFIIEVAPLERLMGETAELIGTNVNANPYKLGRKQQPFHAFVVHGSITLNCPMPLSYKSLRAWFESDEGRVEGIVWHCENGALFKLHRHHLGLPWPIENPRLSQLEFKVAVEGPSEPKGSNWKDKAKKYGPYAAAAVLTPLAVPVVLGVAGFGAGGVVAGSLAAKLMSIAAVANGGGVAAGSAVAVAQSIGAAGLSTAGTAAASSVGVGLVAGTKKVFSFFSRN